MHTDANERTSSPIAKSVEAKLVDLVRKRPILTLGFAVGVGFILGGGFSTRTGRVALLTVLELVTARSMASHA